jgi:hypothetical protein
METLAGRHTSLPDSCKYLNKSYIYGKYRIILDYYGLFGLFTVKVSEKLINLYHIFTVKITNNPIFTVNMGLFQNFTDYFGN